MSEVLIIIHLIIVLALVGIVLLQRSEGGALGMGGGGGFLTSRSKANVLTRTTAVLAGLFFATSMLLAILASPSRQPGSPLDAFAPAPPAQAPQNGILDQLPKSPQTPAAPQPPVQPQAPISK